MCEKCKGLGILKYAQRTADREYCGCAMGTDLKRAEEAIERERVIAVSETTTALRREPNHPSTLTTSRNRSAGDASNSRHGRGGSSAGLGGLQNSTVEAQNENTA